MNNKDLFKGWEIVREGKYVTLFLNPNYDPLDKESYGYYIVLNKYYTVEAAAGSYLLALRMQEACEEEYAALEKGASAKDIVSNSPTIN